MYGFDVVEQNWHWAKACNSWWSGAGFRIVHCLEFDELRERECPSAPQSLPCPQRTQSLKSFQRVQDMSAFILGKLEKCSKRISWFQVRRNKAFFLLNNWLFPPKWPQMHRIVTKTQNYMLPPIESSKTQKGKNARGLRSKTCWSCADSLSSRQDMMLG